MGPGYSSLLSIQQISKCPVCKKDYGIKMDEFMNHKLCLGLQCPDCYKIPLVLREAIVKERDGYRKALESVKAELSDSPPAFVETRDYYYQNECVKIRKALDHIKKVLG
jgi:hypothetical protein